VGHPANNSWHARCVILSCQGGESPGRHLCGHDGLRIARQKERRARSFDTARVARWAQDDKKRCDLLVEKDTIALLFRTY